MRIGSLELGKHATALLVIPRGDMPELRFMVAAPPLERGGMALQLFPMPSPPEVYKTKHGSTAIERDADGKPIVVIKHDDPEYLAGCEKQARRQMAYRFEMALRTDEAVTFDANLSPGKPDRDGDVGKWERWADAILAEIDAAGLTIGHVSAVVAKASSLGAPTAEELTEARDRFLRRVADESSPAPIARLGASSGT